MNHKIGLVRIHLVTPTMRRTPIGSHNVTMVTHFVPSKRLIAYVAVDSGVERVQLCLSKRKHFFWTINILVEQLFRFLLQPVHKHLRGTVTSMGDERI